MSLTQQIAESSPTDSAKIASRLLTVRSRSTNRPRFVEGCDGRTKLMRRRRDLVEMFVAELGGEGHVSPMTMLDVIKAADAAVLSEALRARALRGESVALADLERLENSARAAVQALAIGGRSGERAPYAHSTIWTTKNEGVDTQGSRQSTPTT